MTFTFGKRCSLCGGRLNNKGVCKDCGLDNTRNDSMYKGKINRNDCENKPLTHVHHHEEEKPDLQALKSRLQQKYGDEKSQTGSANYVRKKSSLNNKGEKGKVGCIGWFIVVWFIFVFGIVGLMIFTAQDDMSDMDRFQEEMWDFYEEIKNQGGYMDDSWEIEDYQEEATLASGFYTVGVNIPAGNYTIELYWGDFVSIDLYQYEEGSFYVTGFHHLDGEANPIITDVELSEGTILCVSEDGGIRCTSNDLVSGELVLNENPLTQPYDLQGEAVAGEDFQAGTYDIYYIPSEEEMMASTYGVVDFEIRNEGEELLLADTIYLEGANGEFVYNNVPLLPGSVISVEGVSRVILYPTTYEDPEFSIK